MVIEVDNKTRYRIEPIVQLEGHTGHVWHIAWNPVFPQLASCSTDKSVRLYTFTKTPPTDSDSQQNPRFELATSISTGHSGTVRAIAWAPSGKTLATASFDSTIGIWERQVLDEGEEDGSGEGELGEWECVSTLEGHKSECKSVGYSCSGTLLASCSRDKSVWVWEVQPNADFECMSVMMEHTEDIKSVAWHPNEELLASASYDNTIKLYIDDPDDDWYPFATLKGHDSTVWSTCFSPCGHYLASSSEDRSVRIWRRWQTDKRKGKWEQAVVIQNAHERSVFSVSWGVGKGSESGLGWVASTGGDGTIHIWEITTEGVDQPLKHELIASKLSAHGVRDANAIAWCPLEGHGQMLATAGDDHNVCIWKVTENKAQSC